MKEGHATRSLTFLFYSRFPIPDSRFPIPDSRFPIPNSQFPIPNSQFSILNSTFLILHSTFLISFLYIFLQYPLKKKIIKTLDN
ncbi:MAG: hypothetical protein F6J90_24035 [Moorea sp. SIOASIH]|uniref:hypothetical protein n=1 Tax=Moorena sp. SIOASIH TaxID=2607817 RepID=UPI0013B5F560|nr:hypothetical protein [Moorena sp. SIOASIH]NEO39237.1 hypothetical protein [Moorena sp. SIOASIH]